MMSFTPFMPCVVGSCMPTLSCRSCATTLLCNLPSKVSISSSIPIAAKNLGAASRHVYDGVELGPMIAWLLIAIVLIAGVCGTIQLFGRMLRHWRYNSGRSLFLGLCRVHGLESRSRRLLRQVSQLHQISYPARLFTEPNWLDPARLSGPLRRRGREIELLRRRIFADE